MNGLKFGFVDRDVGLELLDFVEFGLSLENLLCVHGVELGVQLLFFHLDGDDELLDVGVDLQEVLRERLLEELDLLVVVELLGAELELELLELRAELVMLLLELLLGELELGEQVAGVVLDAARAEVEALGAAEELLRLLVRGTEAELPGLLKDLVRSACLSASSSAMKFLESWLTFTSWSSTARQFGHST